YPIFALAEGFGLYLLLRRAGAFVAAALAAWLCGLVIGISTDVLTLTLVVRLAPEYAAAGEAARPALEALARVLDSYIGLMQVVCEALVSVVGLSLFALAVLQSGVAPRWLGWVGLAAAALVGLVYRPLNTLGGDSPPVALAGSLGFMLSAIWDVGMGLTLVQRQEPAGPEEVHGAPNPALQQRGRHDGLPGYEVQSAGPAAELGRSAGHR